MTFNATEYCLPVQWVKSFCVWFSYVEECNTQKKGFRKKIQCFKYILAKRNILRNTQNSITNHLSFWYFLIYIILVTSPRRKKFHKYSCSWTLSILVLHLHMWESKNFISSSFFFIYNSCKYHITIFEHFLQFVNTAGLPANLVFLFIPSFWI